MSRKYNVKIENIQNSVQKYIWGAVNSEQMNQSIQKFVKLIKTLKNPDDFTAFIMTVTNINKKEPVLHRRLSCNAIQQLMQAENKQPRVVEQFLIDYLIERLLDKDVVNDESYQNDVTMTFKSFKQLISVHQLQNLQNKLLEMLNQILIFGEADGQILIQNQIKTKLITRILNFLSQHKTDEEQLQQTKINQFLLQNVENQIFDQATLDQLELQNNFTTFTKDDVKHLFHLIQQGLNSKQGNVQQQAMMLLQKCFNQFSLDDLYKLLQLLKNNKFIQNPVIKQLLDQLQNQLQPLLKDYKPPTDQNDELHLTQNEVVQNIEVLNDSINLNKEAVEEKPEPEFITREKVEENIELDDNTEKQLEVTILQENNQSTQQKSKILYLQEVPIRLIEGAEQIVVTEDFEEQDFYNTSNLSGNVLANSHTTESNINYSPISRRSPTSREQVYNQQYANNENKSLTDQNIAQHVSTINNYIQINNIFLENYDTSELLQKQKLVNILNILNNNEPCFQQLNYIAQDKLSDIVIFLSQKGYFDQMIPWIVDSIKFSQFTTEQSEALLASFAMINQSYCRKQEIDYIVDCLQKKQISQ